MSDHGPHFPQDVPPPMHPTDQALRAMSDAREAALFTRSATERIEELLNRQDTPAAMSTHTLTAQSPVDVDRARHPSRSIGLLNPTTITVYLGAGGTSAQPGRKALSVPPASTLVLPLEIMDLEIGAAAADLAAGDAVVFLFRYESVQPLALARRV